LVTTDILQGCVGETIGESTSASSNPEAQDVLNVASNNIVEQKAIVLTLDIIHRPFQFIIIGNYYNIESQIRFFLPKDNLFFAGRNHRLAHESTRSKLVNRVPTASNRYRHLSVLNSASLAWLLESEPVSIRFHNLDICANTGPTYSSTKRIEYSFELFARCASTSVRCFFAASSLE